MTEQIFRPDAIDLESSDVEPAGQLETCNHLLDDFAALQQFYEENGYLFLKKVLDPASVERARDEMLAAAAKYGLTEPGDSDGRWTGKPMVSGMENDSAFGGISKRLLEAPENQALLEKILGEPACAVPIVQYRTYPPHGPVTRPHQDGFYSPGIDSYKPVWIAMTPCPREMGGMMLAVKQNHGGYFHNLGKPAPYPIPIDAIPSDSWATTDYEPGDMLIVHPHTPHGSKPNRTDRLRVTLDTRVQSARNPTAFAATVKSVTPDSIEIVTDDDAILKFAVDQDTFIRTQHPGRREPLDKFTEVTTPGMRLVVVGKDGRALMLRASAEG